MGRLGRDGMALTHRERARRLRRRSRRAGRDRSGDRRCTVFGLARGLVLLARLPAHTRVGHVAGAARRGGGAHRRSTPRLGRSTVAPLSSRPRRSPGRVRGVRGRDADPCCARRARAAHALPPREDNRVDGEVAFVGGIDLTAYAGNRLDSNEHPVRGAIGWHDATTRVRGPAVHDVAEHFRLRWLEVTGEQLPPVDSTESVGETELQIVRTVPEKVYRRLPRGEFTILESYLRALGSAERLIYLENQFLWSPEIVAVLAERLRNPPDDRFRLLVLLPAKPNNGNDDTHGQLGVLAAADDGANRFLACTLFQAGPGGRPVYVHAKVGIVDDRWLTVGSANLNEHSLFNDTEMNIVTHDQTVAKSTRPQTVERAPRAVDRGNRSRSDRRHRRCLAAPCRGTARAPPSRPATDAPASLLAARLSTGERAARPDQQPARGRLS